MFIALRAIFLEKKFFGEGIVASKIELGQVQPMEEPVCSKDVIKSTMIESHPKPTHKGSDRVPHQLDRYYGF